MTTIYDLTVTVSVQQIAVRLLHAHNREARAGIRVWRIERDWDGLTLHRQESLLRDACELLGVNFEQYRSTP
jgi:hypothetical protein